jgi:spore germination cell wall hydrolase CwlJ-like protein
MSCVIMMPTSVGHQDLAALIARQPAVAERGRQHIRTFTTGTLHTATFSFPRPIGTLIPDAPGYQLASLDPRALDVTGSIPGRDPFEPRLPAAPRYEFPAVNRSLKGDLLMPRDRQPVPAGTPKTKPHKERDLAAPVLSAPDTIPAVSAHEPFAIPQKLIADAARIQMKREAAHKAAQVAKQRADAAMLKAGKTEPFAIAPELIAEAARIDARRSAPAVAEAAVPAPAAESSLSEPFAIAEDLIAEAQRIESARLAPQAPETTPADDVASSETPDESDSEAGEGIAVVENNEILTDEEPRDGDTAAASPAEPENPAMKMAKLYFGAESFGRQHGGLEAYAPGEAPTLVKPADPDIKLSALTPPAAAADDTADHAPDAKSDDKPAAIKDISKHGTPNETIAPKGEVTGEGKRPRTPAERLNLAGASRAKHERCLTNAIYFEARGEEEQGQKAVAQVVMNRVFSPYYPDNVCGVVYQNAHKHLACQFTFACDNVRDVVTEPEAWETAKRISRDTLDGKIWLPEIGKATHYHATYVSPWWKRTMTKYKTLGIHIFYRPKRWGDGADEPTWDPAEVQATGSIKAPDKSRADAFDKPRG